VLGYPIGTFSTTAWFRAKYREAKTKTAAMNPYAHASTVGRNMILQAKYLSYFRFWLFGLIMPKAISTQIEEGREKCGPQFCCEGALREV